MIGEPDIVDFLMWHKTASPSIQVKNLVYKKYRGQNNDTMKKSVKPKKGNIMQKKVMSLIIGAALDCKRLKGNSYQK